MGIFREMYPLHVIESIRDFHEIERMLSEAIGRGYVLELPVNRKLPPGFYSGSRERWFLDLETEEIYSLRNPEERSCGYWEQVDIESIPFTTTEIQ
jgi:hypothetical protein